MSLDDLQAQLRGTLDQQFAALKEQYDNAIAEARRQAVADAERDAAVKLERARAELEQARAEWEIQLRAAAAAARAEGEQQAAEAVQRERQEYEQKLDQAVAGARRTAELELESERRRSQNDVEAARRQAKADADAERQKATAEAEAERQKLKAESEAERQRAQTEIDALRQRTQAELAAARQAAAGAKAPAPPSPPSGVPAAALDRVASAIRDIDAARTLSQALESLLAHAGAAAGRAAVFLINGDRLKAWKASGIPDIDVQTVESSIGAKDLMARAIQTGQATPSSALLPAPPFARLPADRGGLAVPLMIAGRAVAVLYADSGTNAPPAASLEIIELLVRHTSAIVALRTAVKTLDVLGGASDGNGDGDGPGAGGEVSDDQGARRYARLLVSEIKLYNEAAVRAGRQQRDLLQRLRAEIDRAQRLYEERVPPAVGGRHVYFHQELVQTLADGDPALLGSA
jgi:chemotaxis protein histidine kinase CheA